MNARSCAFRTNFPGVRHPGSPSRLTEPTGSFLVLRCRVPPGESLAGHTVTRAIAYRLESSTTLAPTLVGFTATSTDYCWQMPDGKHKKAPLTDEASMIRLCLTDHL